MAVLCSTNCGSISNVPSNYGGCKVTTRKWGWNQFILINCDYQFTDMTDTDEWQTAIDGGEIAVSPKGIIDFPTPTLNSVTVTGCGQKIPLPTEYQIDYTTYDTDPTNQLDYQYFKDLLSDHQDWRIMFFNCNNEIIFENDWVDEVSDAIANSQPATISASNPGFEFSVTQAPYFTGDNDLFTWNTQFEIESSEGFTAIQIPGVISLLT